MGGEGGDWPSLCVAAGVVWWGEVVGWRGGVRWRLGRGGVVVGPPPSREAPIGKEPSFLISWISVQDCS